MDVKLGDIITILKAPKREGYSFQYWKGSKYNPGDKYEVVGSHTFTAIWEKKQEIGSNSNTSSGNINKNKPSDSRKAVAYTSDNTSIEIYIGMALILTISALAIRIYRRKNF